MNRMRPRKYLLFDFDGTIVDSLPVLIKIYNRVAPGFKCKTVTAQEVKLLQKKRPQDFMKEYGVTLLKLPFMVVKMRSEVKNEIINLNSFYNIIDVIRVLRKKNFGIGMLTTNSLSNIKMYLDSKNLQNDFDFIHTAKNIFGKHRSIKRILKKHSIQPEDLIYRG